jgi:acetyl/propionyl-CoA carboxylase alpha subunit
LKLRVQLGEDSFVLDFRSNGSNSSIAYTLRSAEHRPDDTSIKGEASLEQVRPHLYSVLTGTRSFAVYVVPRGNEIEVWVDHKRHLLTVFDPRDFAASGRGAAAKGRSQVSTQMPGKVIRILVEAGAYVKAGQGLIIVEAMKMQNELKAPRDGTVSRIAAVEGATVAANQPLVVIE